MIEQFASCLFKTIQLTVLHKIIFQHTFVKVVLDPVGIVIV